MRLVVTEIATGEIIDVSKNLYWFEENYVDKMDNGGVAKDNYGNAYKIEMIEIQNMSRAYRRNTARIGRSIYSTCAQRKIEYNWVTVWRVA